MDATQEQAEAASIAGVVIVGCHRSAYRQNGALVRLEIKSGRVTLQPENGWVQALRRIAPKMRRCGKPRTRSTLKLCARRAEWVGRKNSTIAAPIGTSAIPTHISGLISLLAGFIHIVCKALMTGAPPNTSALTKVAVHPRDAGYAIR
jgi:hypothetical protein